MTPNRSLLFFPALVVATVGILAGCNHNESKNNKIIVNSASANQHDLQRNLALDKSPMDMTYFPADYPILRMSGNMEKPLVSRVIYSRPRKDGRVIFGEVVKYGSVWRLGANEATELEFFRDVYIQNKRVGKGRYVLYCIPSPNSWKLILNEDLNTWGLKIDRTKDLYSFDVPLVAIQHPVEVFTIDFANTSKGADLMIGWDKTLAVLPIEIR